MKIVVPTFIFDEKDINNQLKLTLAFINSYYFHDGNLDITVVTNNDIVEYVVGKYNKQCDYNVNVDKVSLNTVENNVTKLKKFFEKYNNNRVGTHNRYVYLIYFYIYKNYSDCVFCDNDMLFLENVDFKSICEGSKTFLDFSNYKKIKQSDWSVQEYLNENFRNGYETHGGCSYIPNDFPFVDVFENDMINDVVLINEDCEFTMTDEYLRVYMSIFKNYIKKYEGEGINCYNYYGNDNVKLVHFQLKPFNFEITKDKKFHFTSFKPLTEFCKETIQTTIITKPMIVNFLEWNKQLYLANLKIDKYFRDVWFDDKFYDGIINAIK